MKTTKTKTKIEWYELKVEGFKKHKGKELRYCELKREKAPKSTPHTHFYNITVCASKQ